MKKRIVAAALGAAILAIPAAAVADSGHGKRHGKQPMAKKVTFVFNGIYTVPGTLEVRSGNAHVRQGGFVGQKINLDLTTALVVAADGNSDGKVDLSDVNNGDVVLVQARLHKDTKYVAPAEDATVAAIVASRLIDKTNPPADAE